MRLHSVSGRDVYKYTHANAHLCVTLEDVIYPGKGKHCRLIVNALLSGSRLLSAALHLTVNAAHEATDSYAHSKAHVARCYFFGHCSFCQAERMLVSKVYFGRRFVSLCLLFMFALFGCESVCSVCAQ